MSSPGQTVHLNQALLCLRYVVPLGEVSSHDEVTSLPEEDVYFYETCLNSIYGLAGLRGRLDGPRPFLGTTLPGKARNGALPR